MRFLEKRNCPPNDEERPKLTYLKKTVSQVNDIEALITER